MLQRREMTRGSFATEASGPRANLCPLWSNSGQTHLRLECPLSAKSGRSVWQFKFFSCETKRRLGVFIPPRFNTSLSMDEVERPIHRGRLVRMLYAG